MSSTHAGLKVDGLTRRLGGRDVVKDVSLSVEPGRVTCLLGPSGCGKSTTLRLIAGVDCQDKGTVSLGGRVVSDGVIHEPPEARHVGLMFQDFALFPHLSVAENVAFGLTGSKREKESRVKSLLERVHLEDFIGAHPHELSGGEQQRVALARAIAPKPAIMLMDEPFSGLDNRLRDDIRDETLDILKEDGTAVLLVTHEPDEAMRMADEIALMRRGEIVQRGAPYNIYNAPVDKEAAAFFSDINVIPGVVKGALTDTQHLRIDFDRQGRGPLPTPEDGTPAMARVLRARFMGRESLVEFEMDHDGSVLKATVPSVFLPKPGTVLWLMIRRGRCFVFPRDS